MLSLPWGQLLGKRWPLALACDDKLCLCNFPMQYPGSYFKKKLSFDLLTPPQVSGGGRWGKGSASKIFATMFLHS